MKPPPPVTSVVTTVLVTVLLAALAYGTTSGALSRQRDSQRAAAAAPAPPSPSPALPSPSAAPTPVFPSAVPSKTRPLVIDADFISVADGWALITDCFEVAASARCSYSTSSTVNGGSSWTHPVQVGPSFPVSPQDSGAPRSIRFLDRLDGFVWGQSGAWVTHDGGKTWKGITIKTTFVADIAINGSTVWAVTYPCAKGPTPTPCPDEVRSSLDGGRTWSAPHSLPANFSPDIAVAFPSGLILSNVSQGDIQLAVNGGATWQDIKAPCVTSPFSAAATTADGQQLWVVCSGAPSPGAAVGAQDLFVSEDGGASWTQRLSFPQPGYGWVVLSPQRVGFWRTDRATLASVDAGLTWVPATADVALFQTIRFVGSQWGWALDSNNAVWDTTDGGNTWGRQIGVLPYNIG